MIINSIIAGGGSTAIETYMTVYDITSTVTLSQFLANYDVRFHYKNSYLTLFVQNNNVAAGSTIKRIKMVLIPNLDNFNNPSGYDAVVYNGNGTRFTWAILTSWDNDSVSISNFSADATTGRISSTYTTGTIGVNGTQIIAYEIPTKLLPTDSGNIDTTPWGAP